jgi:hypothetical protein
MIEHAFVSDDVSILVSTPRTENNYYSAKTQETIRINSRTQHSTLIKSSKLMAYVLMAYD